MSDYEVRQWGNEDDEWPEKRVSIADDNGHAIAISPRYANENTIEQMRFLATAPTLANRVAELERRLEIDPRHDYDGIATRDRTIADLEATVARYKEALEEIADICVSPDLVARGALEGGC
jgi:hypothetical protein